MLAVVTGGSRGLGRELALALAKEGYDVLVCSRGGAKLEAVRKEIAALGTSCRLWPGDLTGRSGRDLRLFLESRSVDVLINNAAAAPQLKCLEELTASDYNRMFSLNLYTPYRLMQAAIPSMRARGSGVIVNVCSLSGRRAIRNASLYSASKFALRGLTEAVAQELEGTGVRCFSVSPGGMNTSMRDGLFGDASQQQDPAAVAQIIVDAIAGRVKVPQGADLVIHGGLYSVVSPEKWVGITGELQCSRINFDLPWCEIRGCRNPRGYRSPCPCGGSHASILCDQHYQSVLKTQVHL